MRHAIRGSFAVGVVLCAVVATGCVTSSSSPPNKATPKDAGTPVEPVVDAGVADASQAKDAGGGSPFTPGLQYNGSIGFESAQ